MDSTVDKVLNIANAEVGYLEKKSNSQLDSKTANAGSGNYTKYGRDMHNIYPSVMDFPAAWCDAFIDWLFYMAYGISNARALLSGDFNDYTVASAQLYKNKKAWYTTPKVGDQIFFKNSQRICHTGIVYKVDSKKVYTIEGNTSGASGVIANGGGVCKKSYLLTDSKIAGYGRPKYDKETEKEKANNTGNSVSSGASIKIDYAKNYWKSYAKSYKTTSDLNMRKGAGTNKEKITVIPKGATVRCYGYYSTNGSTVWLLVTYGKYTGFCSKNYLK